MQVERDRQEDGPGRRRQSRLHRSPHGRGNVFHPLHLDGPFGPRPNDAEHVAPQNRLLELQPAILLAGGEQQRRAGAEGVVEHPHRVAQAGADVNIDDAQLARGHRIAVGHRHHGDFLQAEDVLQPSVGRHRVAKRQLGRAGIAEQKADAGSREHFEKGVDATHEEGARGEGLGDEDTALGRVPV